MASEFAGSLTRPLTEPAFRLLSGHSAIRPRAGPEAESVNRSGLSQTSVPIRFLKNEPSYPTRTSPRPPVHSAAAPTSVVRVSRGAGSSTASLKPKVPAHGCSPLFWVFLNVTLKSRSRRAL